VIEGVIIKDLETHVDERGFFREIIRVTDGFFGEGFGQWSHSLMYQGVVKAWHVHNVQVDWWYIGTGVLKVGLHDTRVDSPSYGETMVLIMGENHPSRILRIPPGVAHGCKALSGPVNLFYVTSRVYDPADEIRIAHDDPKIRFDWLKGPAVR